MRAFVVAVRFLTRVPMPGRDVEASELAGAAAWFPTVGAGVGAFTAGAITLAARACALDVAIVIGLAFAALVTGAFHEDGLADACDGLGGGFTRERALEIMRDSRIGSYGAIALVLLYLARFTLFRELGTAKMYVALPAAACLARATSVALMAIFPSDREGRTLDKGTVAFGLLSAIAVAIALGQIAMIAASAIVTIGASLYFRRRLGGITGDCLGAVNVIAEVASLACGVAL
jgi:adenosylcobinamide-GDP ribazoletransferase